MGLGPGTKIQGAVRGRDGEGRRGGPAADGAGPRADRAPEAGNQQVARLHIIIGAARYDEYRELRSRTARARQEYEEGVNKRIGGVANDGRYAASQKIQLGNSFSGLINSKDDVTAKIYQNNQQQEDGAPPPPKKKLFGFK